jgi:hypothetical protein
MREHGVAEFDCERASCAFDLLVRNVRISGRIWALSAHLVENDRPILSDADAAQGIAPPVPGHINGDAASCATVVE